MAGPIFYRELHAAPRRPRSFVLRTVYPAALAGLAATAWLLVTGSQSIRNLGDLALFGTLCFQFLAPLQLALVLVLAPLGTAGKIAAEKDRKTLDLLLLTRLADFELVVGETLAGLLSLLVLITAGLPIFLLLLLLGGTAPIQVLDAFCIYYGTAFAAGSLAACLAFRQDKTYQTVALSLLLLSGWTGGWEAVRQANLGRPEGASWVRTAETFSPWAAMRGAVAVGPSLGRDVWSERPGVRFLPAALLLGAIFQGIAVARVRVWNTTRSIRTERPTELDSIFPKLAEKSAAEQAVAADPHAERNRSRRAMWERPILWREVRTAAYGRRILLVKTAFVLLFAAAAAFLYRGSGFDGTLTKWQAFQVAAPLFALSLLLVNALAVNSLAQERDGRTLDLLLVTDLTPPEVIFGKLGGIAWNAKEMILLPCLLAVGLWFWRDFRGSPLLTFEQLVYVLCGLGTLQLFCGVLGLHAAMTYAESRSAMAVGLGTLLFLFLGVAACMRLLIAFGGDFQVQFIPFSALIFGGGVALYVVLGARNPSPAIAWTAFLLPVATFYSLNCFLLDQPHMVWVVTVGVFGFSTASLLVPALAEFDFASPRSLEPGD